jgi:hypothetical protein
LFSKATDFKIIRNGYYWPLIFKYSYKFTRYCDKFQKFYGKERLSSMPLQPVLPYSPFSTWGLDFIGPTNPSSSLRHIFILTGTDYFTKWTKVVPLRHTHDEKVVFFL